MVRIAVVEDEQKQMEQLCGFLNRYGDEHNQVLRVYRFSDGEALLADYPKELDILFMDIRMAHMDGIMTAERVRTFDSRVILIFATNMVDYALKGYELDAMDYVVKPLYYASFCRRMEKAVRRLEGQRTHMIEIKSKKNDAFINVDELQYCETFNKSLILHTSRQNFWCSETMEELEQKLASYPFYRCHRSFLINLDYVENIGAQGVTVAGSEIPLSKYRRKEFFSTVANYIGSRI